MMPVALRARRLRASFPSLALCALFAAQCGPGGGGGGTPDAGALAPLPTIEGLDELPDLNPDPRIVEVNLTAGEAEVELNPGRMTRVWAYNGRVPGPLLHARVGDRVIVHFRNELREPTTVHWHGLRIYDEMDGSPRVQDPVPAGGSFTYDFVVPDAGTYWYHAHVHETQQLERGLYGAIVVHEASPPQFTAERVFVLDDVRLSADAQVSRFETSGPDIGRGRIGNTLLCNGRSRPGAATVARGAVERWRVINAGNALMHVLTVEGASFRVIGTDGGFLPQPYEAPEVELAPGQRAELEVRFDRDDASAAKLLTVLQVVRDNGSVGSEDYTMFEATFGAERVAPPTPVYPLVNHPATDVPAEQIDMLLSGRATDAGVEFTINGMAGHNHRLPPLQVMRGQPVRITVRADVSPGHPFHLHGQFFQVVARQGAPVNEPGLRDVAWVRGRESVTVLTYFENPGMWMYHCHINEHSENGMMGEFEVLDRR